MVFMNKPCKRFLGCELMQRILYINDAVDAKIRYHFAIGKTRITLITAQHNRSREPVLRESSHLFGGGPTFKITRGSFFVSDV